MTDTPSIHDEKVYVFVCKGDACTQKGNPERLRVLLKQIARELPPKAVKVTYASCLGMCGEGPNILVCKGGEVLNRCTEQSRDALERVVRGALGFPG